MLRSLAWQLTRRMPSWVELDDLISEGQLALVKAAHDFDSSRGAAFGTYAYTRIRGAMLDWARKQRWFQAFRYHSADWSSDVQSDQIQESDAVTSDLSGQRLVRQMTEEVADSRAADPGLATSENELRELLRDLVSKLEGRSRQILEATLLDERTLEQAGDAAGIHKGTAQRAQVKGFERLAELIRERGLGDFEGEQLRSVVCNTHETTKTKSTRSGQ